MRLKIARSTIVNRTRGQLLIDRPQFCLNTGPNIGQYISGNPVVIDRQSFLQIDNGMFPSGRYNDELTAFCCTMTFTSFSSRKPPWVRRRAIPFLSIHFRIKRGNAKHRCAMPSWTFSNSYRQIGKYMGFRMLRGAANIWSGSVQSKDSLSNGG
jgi:hypothetical protein